jgi:(1->4)-alpha-D-glucan 1-alpha-D-glucosylmutase
VTFPRATYRLQLHSGFTFADATRVVPYLARLGISHVYASPILKARAGSTHGYDVIDHGQLNPELGTRADFERLAATLREHDMGLIVDVVPNHLGVMGHDNVWWLDVLESGPAARYAGHFDIDWRPNRTSMRDRVLVPVLGDAYGTVLERGELVVALDATDGSFALRYHEHRFPIDPREYPRIFALQIPDEVLPPEHPDRADFESLMHAFAQLPVRSDTSTDARTIRYRDKEAHKRRLVRLLERSPPLGEYVRVALAHVNGKQGEPASFDALDALIEAQAYRLSFWRVAIDEINYRRFFDVNDLAALQMNDAEVFEATHWLIFELIEAGQIQGLRIDHSDGLYDPEAYFARVQQRLGATAENPKPFYLVTEKILATHERLPESWLVHGTTGYEFAALATAWLVAAEGETRATRRYRQFTGAVASFDEVAHDSKLLVMRVSLAAEIEVLATQLDRIAQLDRHTADFTRASLREAIREVIACFPVYRTYVSERGVSDEDRRIVHWAVNVARKRATAGDTSVYDFLRAVLLGDAPERRLPAQVEAMREFAMKFQQVTSPVTAKGVEDTAFYRFNRLVCLNDVGGDPRRFSASNAAVHQANAERARAWPHSLLASSTHDTKRSEDVRARIAVLSELPDAWKRHITRWQRLNRDKHRDLEGSTAPDAEDEYLLYQTLVGVWSAEGDSAALVERLQQYLIKAAREAKRATSWVNPNSEYEARLTSFVAELFDAPERNPFLRDFTPFAMTVAHFARIGVLAQTVLKLTAPGVPDFYQGTETLSLTLVDPDNRRPVDFDGLDRDLRELECGHATLARLLEGDGSQLKLLATWTLLQLRKRAPDLFARGTYEALRVEGALKDYILAFARVHEGRSCIVIVSRWGATLLNGERDLPIGDAWGDTRVVVEGVALSTTRELFTGRTLDASHASISVSDVLRELPVAVVVSE